MNRHIHADSLGHNNRNINQGKYSKPIQTVRDNECVNGIALEQRHKDIHSRKQNIKTQRNCEKLLIRLEKRKQLHPYAEAKGIVILLFFICCH